MDGKEEEDEECLGGWAIEGRGWDKEGWRKGWRLKEGSQAGG